MDERRGTRGQVEPRLEGGPGLDVAFLAQTAEAPELPGNEFVMVSAGRNAGIKAHS